MVGIQGQSPVFHLPGGAVGLVPENMPSLLGFSIKQGFPATGIFQSSIRIVCGGIYGCERSEEQEGERGKDRISHVVYLIERIYLTIASASS